MFELVCLYDFGDHGSSHPELFHKKVIVKTFIKFTVKHLCWSLLKLTKRGKRESLCTGIFS